VGSTESVAQRPELLANHWPQLPWWTERQAPNVNIGVVHCREQFTRPELHDLPLFHLWDLDCSTESPPTPWLLLGRHRAIVDLRMHADAIVFGSDRHRAFRCHFATLTKT
jgi:hypothetical protein